MTQVAEVAVKSAGRKPQDLPSRDAAGNAIEITPSNASTGDTSMIVAAVALAAVALVGMAVLLIINMKKGAKK